VTLEVTIVAHFDGWWSIEEGSVELEAVLYHVLGQLAIQYSVIYIKTYKQNPWFDKVGKSFLRSAIGLLTEEEGH